MACYTTSYILFGTTFGKFIRASIGATVNGVGALIKAIRFLRTQQRMGNLVGHFSGMLGKGGKAALIGAGILGTVAIGSSIVSAVSTPKEEKELESSGDDLEGSSTPELQFSGGGENDLSSMKPFDAEDGGIVKGKKGKDKNLGWLTDGEIVLTEKVRDRAIKETGIDPLVFNIDGSPDANRPTIKNETYYASGGGVIGRDKYLGRGETTASPKMMMSSNIFDNSLLRSENMFSSEQYFNMPSVSQDISFSNENNSTDYSTIDSSNRFFSDNIIVNNSKSNSKNILEKVLGNGMINNIIKHGSNIINHGGNIFNHPGNIFNLGNTVSNDSDKSSSTIIKENTGMDIPGGTSDRQRLTIDVQPGETKVIVPNEVVQRGGLHHIENIINMYDDGTSFASRNSGNIEMPEPPQTKQPRITFISSPDQDQTIETGGSELDEVEMFDATFVSSRKLKTLGVG